MVRRGNRHPSGSNRTGNSEAQVDLVALDGGNRYFIVSRWPTRIQIYELIRNPKKETTFFNDVSPETEARVLQAL